MLHITTTGFINALTLEICSLPGILGTVCIKMIGSLYFDYLGSRFQSIGTFPACSSSSLHLEKCLQPRKPLWAERGLGWVEWRMWWRDLSTYAPFFCAYAPHSRKTTPSQLSEIHLMTASVSFSQPRSLWELALAEVTVRTAFRRRTPWSAHPVRWPWSGLVKPSIGRRLLQ